MTEWCYNFPEYAGDTDLSRQTAKVLEEVCEVFMALCNRECMERVAEETLDAHAALEKLEHMIERDGVNLVEIRREVIAKNTARGYYGGM